MSKDRPLSDVGSSTNRPAESAKYKYHTLDVFTDRTFGGNPLAVLTDARGLSTGQMQRITSEFNLSETVFVLPPDNPKHTRKLRIFTPGRELPFAGHPTVGTAFLLAASGMIDIADGDTQIVLEEGVGPVAVTLSVKDGAPISATLTAAQAPELRRDVPHVADVAEMLTLDISDVGAPGLSIAAVSCGMPFLLVPLRSRECVSRAKLRREAWESVLSNAWAREIFLFDGSAIERRTPIRARMFAPSLGIGEDPATGSAAATLAAYLAMRNDSANARLDWVVEQGVEMGRPSVLKLSADISRGEVSGIRVGGQCVLVSEGTMTVPRF